MDNWFPRVPYFLGCIHVHRAQQLRRQSLEAEIIVREFLNGTGIHNTSFNRSKDADYSTKAELILCVRVMFDRLKQVETVSLGQINESTFRPLKMWAPIFPESVRAWGVHGFRPLNRGSRTRNWRRWSLQGLLVTQLDISPGPPQHRHMYSRPTESVVPWCPTSCTNPGLEFRSSWLGLAAPSSFRSRGSSGGGAHGDK